MRDIYGDRIHPVVVYGAGGHGRETAQLIEDINAHRARWDVLGFIDDNPSLHGREINGLPVLGGIEWLRSEGANAWGPHWNPASVSQNFPNAEAKGELLSTSASTVARPKSNPDDGPQRTN